MQSFFSSSKLLKQWNSTAIILVPKVKSLSSSRDYRPIACCHTIYKSISKFICSRLTLVLSDIVSLNQGAFVKGRSIIHNILLCKEIVRHYSRKNCSPSCLIKVDLSKAYDTMDWLFIKDMLAALGSPIDGRYLSS